MPHSLTSGVFMTAREILTIEELGDMKLTLGSLTLHPLPYRPAIDVAKPAVA